jgi:glucose/arabinose dehydrogenase
MSTQATILFERLKKNCGICQTFIIAVCIMLAATSCSGGSSPSPATTAAASDTPSSTLQAATQTVNVTVPASMATSPFDQPRTLNVPPGFSISVFARVPDARFMSVAPNGDLLVSEPDDGTIVLLRPNGKALGQTFTFASNLHNPHDIVFDTLNGITYEYIAESNQIIRAPYTNGETTVGATQVVVSNLPDASTTGLTGYMHQLKNIALNGNELYVSIGSSCNACASDTTANPVRGAIYEYDANGSTDATTGRLVARGIRNAEGIRFQPGTNNLWLAVNNRDDIAFPFHADFDGDGTDDFGKVIQSYVDGHPPDLLINAQNGGNYGWPFCNSNPDNGLDNMPFDRDAQTNADGSSLDCNAINRVTKGIAAHSAPLGLSFLQNSALPESYRNAFVVALHGCWDCTALNGHKIALYPFNADGTLGNSIDLVTGWIIDAQAKQRWGRPVDAVPGQDGLYISDDFSGTIYLLSSS